MLPTLNSALEQWRNDHGSEIDYLITDREIVALADLIEDAEAMLSGSKKPHHQLVYNMKSIASVVKEHDVMLFGGQLDSHCHHFKMEYLANLGLNFDKKIIILSDGKIILY